MGRRPTYWWRRLGCCGSLSTEPVGARFARSFPLGTLTVNLFGAAVLGIISGLALQGGAVLLAGTAAVSTWMLETRLLGEERQRRAAATNIVASVIVGVTAAPVGQTIAACL